MLNRVALAFQLIIAALQVVVGCISFIWAIPLFADPPFLGNGLVREHGKLRRLLEGNEQALQPLQDLHAKLWWLFDNHMDGVLVALVAGIALIVSGVAQAAISVFLHSRRPQFGA
ncbi:hypothetical protein [Arenimonas terrae]|jgi:hypothetical protein|uniref:Uncharacterized protein n=1 Tax=Arenimonas terrae TaxID=2546226 RepID=A0A5C4RPT6_9GAMM|nr:hypothetical protein [Arenimonas terrae]TNJ32647.1 hypothetical protein E1B00_14705 [Arenimonas terrae]